VKLAENTLEKTIEFNPEEEEVLFYRDNLNHVYQKFDPFF